MWAKTETRDLLESTKMAQIVDEETAHVLDQLDQDSVAEFAQESNGPQLEDEPAGSQPDLTWYLLKVEYPTPELPGRHIVVEAALEYMRERKYKAEDKRRVDAIAQSCKAAFLPFGPILTSAQLQTLGEHIVEIEVRLHECIYWISDPCGDTTGEEYIATIVLEDAHHHHL